MADAVTPALRDIGAAKAAQHQYAHAYDRLAERAQVFAGAGQPLLARLTAHQAALALRAFRAECRDPEPRPPCRAEP